MFGKIHHVIIIAVNITSRSDVLKGDVGTTVCWIHRLGLHKVIQIPSVSFLVKKSRLAM